MDKMVETYSIRVLLWICIKNMF